MTSSPLMLIRLHRVIRNTYVENLFQPVTRQENRAKGDNGFPIFQEFSF